MPVKARLSLALVAIASVFPAWSAEQQAPPPEKVVVFIECVGPDGKTARGSGVVASADGLVITALHVARPEHYAKLPNPRDFACRGTIGFANPGQGTPLMFKSAAEDGKDAALLQFTEPRTYDYVRYCRLDRNAARRDIFVGGFPGGDMFRYASYRKGVLSTSQTYAGGILESDGQTVAGMSGGPVYAGDLKGFVGIVSGAQVSATGAVDFYGVIPAAEFADKFHLETTGEPCFRPSREISLPREGEWVAGQDALPLGVRDSDGICFLSAVTGRMDNPTDTIEVVLVDGEYVIRGGKPSSGAPEYGGRARCMRTD